MGDDGVVLTDREREALVELAQSIGDPWLARQLVGQDPPRPRRRRRFARLTAAAQRATAGRYGAALLVVGAVLAVATFVASTVIASLGLLVMGVGLWRLVTDHGDRIVRWRLVRRNREAEPPPPHRQPGAA